MRCFLKSLVLSGATCGIMFTGLPIQAQTPTYAPGSPLIAPGEPLSSPATPSTIPQTPTPSSTIPQPAPESTIPGNSFSAPNATPSTPPATIVTPGTVTPGPRPWGAWYPGYWLGFRTSDPPYGGGAVPYRTNYQGYPLPPGAGGCNTCQPAAPVAPVAPCGPCGRRNLDFGRGYDGFMTGW